jgi:hypothetical protein
MIHRPSAKLRRTNLVEGMKRRRTQMRKYILLSFLAVSGCVEPPPPTQAQVALEGACQDGDVGACQTIVEMEQRERERRSAVPAPVFVDMRQDPSAFQSQRQSQATTGMKVCPNGLIVPQYNFC